MAKGKRQFSRPPAGGIKRNKYHRRNRRRNISTHNTSRGVTLPLGHIRLVKRADRAAFLQRQVQEFNENQPRVPVAPDMQRDFNYAAALCSLEFPELLYRPPFLTRDEIRARRFSTQYGEMNDRWWEWERERRVMSTKGQPTRFVWK